MPHDMIAADAETQRAETPRSLGHQRLAMLARALRAPLPERFTWDFGTVYETPSCGTVGCALGVAAVAVPGMLEQCGPDFTDDEVEAFFGIDGMAVWQLFYDNDTYAKHYTHVTPADIAGAIEHFLDTGDLPRPAKRHQVVG